MGGTSSPPPYKKLGGKDIEYTEYIHKFITMWDENMCAMWNIYTNSTQYYTENSIMFKPESDELASTIGRSFFISFFDKRSSLHFRRPSRAFILKTVK